MSVLTLQFENEPMFRWEQEEFNEFLEWCSERHVSDVKLQSGMPIWVRIHGEWFPVTRRICTSDEISCLLTAMVKTSVAVARINSQEDCDFSYEMKKKGSRFDSLRFRGNASGMRYGHSLGYSITMRFIASQPPLLDELTPESIITEAGFPVSGLVLVTGVMGSGKTTLLAAMIRWIIENQRRNVLTYENPIEYDLMSFENPMGTCTQTEIPTHLKKFDEAAKNAARRAADVILLGEARDAETISGMLELSEIGVAAYSTVHTRSVAATPTRIINTFPAHEQAQVAITLLSALRLIVQTRLVERLGGGRVAIREILAINDTMRDELIKTPVTGLIPKLQGYVADQGLPLVEDAKIKYENGLISRETLSLVRKQIA